MKRRYELKERARRQAETRQRIVEATFIELPPTMRGRRRHLGHRGARRRRAAHGLRPLPRRADALARLLHALARPTSTTRHPTMARARRPRTATPRRALRRVRLVRGRRVRPRGPPPRCGLVPTQAESMAETTAAASELADVPRAAGRDGRPCAPPSATRSSSRPGAHSSAGRACRASRPSTRRYASSRASSLVRALGVGIRRLRASARAADPPVFRPGAGGRGTGSGSGFVMR